MGALGTAGLLGLWLLPPSLTLCVVCFLAIGTSTAWVDVLCNAYIADSARKEGSLRAAAELQSFSFATFAAGTLLGNLLSGVLYSALASARLCFGLCSACSISMLLLPKVIREERLRGRAGSCRPDSAGIRGAWRALRPSGPTQGVVVTITTIMMLSRCVCCPSR